MAPPAQRCETVMQHALDIQLVKMSFRNCSETALYSFSFFFVVKNLMALEGRRRRVERGRGKFFGTAIARCLNVGLKIAVKIPRHFLIGQRHLADCTGCALVLFHSSGTAPGIAGCLSEIAVAPTLEPL